MRCLVLDVVGCTVRFNLECLFIEAGMITENKLILFNFFYQKILGTLKKLM